MPLFTKSLIEGDVPPWGRQFVIRGFFIEKLLPEIFGKLF